MICEITMNGVASYKQPVRISGLKKFNLFYGLNGTGKSVLSRYLSICDEPTEEYKGCSYKTDSSDIEILVYNQDFIKEHFQESQQQQGIFTLDKANTEALVAITAARKEIKTLAARKEPFTDQIQILEEKQEKQEAELIEVLWKERQIHNRTILHKCLGGSGTKQSNYERVLSVEASDIETEQIADELTRLTSELTELSDDNAEKKTHYPLLNESFKNSETNELFQQKIVGAEDSYLSEIVSQLSHQDWVTHGIKDYLDRTNDCPFCGRFMDQDLKDKIKAFINTSYQTKLNELEALKASYAEKKRATEDNLRLYKDDAALLQNAELKNLIEGLQSALDLNSRLIEKKCDEPSQPVQLRETLDHINAIDDLIKAENDKVDVFNQKIDNRQIAIAQIKEEFWQLIKRKYASKISNFKEEEEKITQCLGKAQSQAKELQDQIKAQEDIISANQESTKNLEKAVNRINTLLKDFGMEGFRLAKVNTIDEVKGTDDISDFDNLPLYEIIRDNPSDKEKEFESLSEGEKTLISFLYFLEVCQGMDDADKDGDTSKRVIVIDDPISSLSFNLVFDTAILIKDIFLRKKTDFHQVFILTHHLYFLHELLGNPKDSSVPEIMLYRVFKTGHSQVTSMKRKEIQNHYESYWQIVKDATNNQNFSPVLPNAMRNILEHYFSFVHAEDKYFKAIEKLSEEHNNPAYKAFARYLGRGSHSGNTNITDMAEIDVAKFLHYFKQIFIETDFEKHYIQMMGINVIANDDGHSTAVA